MSSTRPGTAQGQAERGMTIFLIATFWLTSSLMLGTLIHSHFSHTPVITWNPVALLINQISGNQPGNALKWAAIGAVALSEVGLYYLYRHLRTPRRKPQKRRGDEVARVTGSDITTFTEKAAAEKAARFGVQVPGLPIGITVRDATALFTDWESVSLIIAGMRMGKTAAWVINRILAAPGAVLNTSNKRDVVDTTIGPRTKTGQQAWVFDPQGVVGKPQTCWWNPLTYITGSAAAERLANVLVDANRSQEATTNAFFDNTSRDLVASLLLAAALDKRPITDLSFWVNDDSDDTPREILLAHGYTEWAARIRNIATLVPQTKSGVYGGASTMLQFLMHRENTAWLTPQSGLPEFHPDNFVSSQETLYVLSLEGGGSAAPILAALTVAVAEAALKLGSTKPSGRLDTPMYICLDEAANICPWRELPNQYSHFGSRGIVVDTILQSWNQGVEVWGEHGMQKLWGPTNFAVYLGGSREITFLRWMSELIGDIWEDSTTITNSNGRTSKTRNIGTNRRPIASVADLASLPVGRAWVFASGATPTLVETQFWMNSANAAAIEQSVRTHAQ